MNHPLLIAGYQLLAKYQVGGGIPITSFRIYLAEIEASLERRDELAENGSRLEDARNQWGYPTKLKNPF